MMDKSRVDYKLSILIPTIPERQSKFDYLREEVRRQAAACYKIHPVLGVVEIVVDNSKKFTEGGITIGAKRQNLITEANGEYLCFLDDDEAVSPDYVETLLRLCWEKPDIGTFNNLSKLDNYWMVVRMSLHTRDNEQARPGIIKRRPWHICPVRSSIAKKYSFPDSNYGEDWVWFEQVLKDCKKEFHYENIIHQYNFSKVNSQADNKTTSIG
jgi:hypothetical protein